MKTFLYGFLLLSAGLASRAQRLYTLSGNLKDSLTGLPVPAATVSLLDYRDSSLSAFTLTNQKGAFLIPRVAAGKYRLLLTHVQFHAVEIPLQVAGDQAEIILGSIALMDHKVTLPEVVVSAVPPVTLRGDTIQYHADAFRTAPNATVEQLLRKLPGLEVERDGTIRAQGQEVTRVLVDGREFFGTDPKIATRNLPADAIDKVEVFDRLSEAAKLTGFDDGSSEKAINLRLKEDRRKGRFGNVRVGGGSEARYSGNASLHAFDDRERFSALAMANNTNEEGFSFRDLMTSAPETGRMRQSGGMQGANPSRAGSNPASPGAASRDGLNQLWAGGLNYNSIVGGTTLSAHYFFNGSQPYQESSSVREYLLPDSSYSAHREEVAESRAWSHRAGLTGDIRFDSLYSLRVSPSIQFQQPERLRSASYETLTGAGKVANAGWSRSLSGGHALEFFNEVLLRRLFSRTARSFSLGLETRIGSRDRMISPIPA